MFSKPKLRNGFQEVALSIYSKPWLHLTRTPSFFSNIYSSVIDCLLVCIMYFVR